MTLNLIVLRVADLARSAEFFAAFGIHFKSEQHGNGPEHLAANLNGITFELYPSKAATVSAGTRIGLRVRSVAATLQAIADRGIGQATSARPGEWGLRAVVTDPDGHKVELTEGD